MKKNIDISAIMDGDVYNVDCLYDNADLNYHTTFNNESELVYFDNKYIQVIALLQKKTPYTYEIKNPMFLYFGGAGDPEAEEINIKRIENICDAIAKDIFVKDLFNIDIPKKVSLEELNPVLNKTIEELELTTRSARCLKASNICSVKDLVNATHNELKKIPNLGGRSINEIKVRLAECNLKLKEER